MKILYSPQVKLNNNTIEYSFNGDIITCNINGITDIFDFTDVEEGKLLLYDEEGNPLFETILPVMPIIEARKDSNGELWVKLLIWISEDEQDESILYPDWREV